MVILIVLVVAILFMWIDWTPERHKPTVTLDLTSLTGRKRS